MSALAQRAIPLPRRGASVPSWLLACGAAALGVALEAPRVGFVLGGGFGDPDDAMRLVEVRAWLAGQSWFDVGAHRLDPPLGAAMHWSRLVDLPSALMIKVFAPFAGLGQAEAWTRVAVPTLLLVALYLGMARLATLLVGRDLRIAAVLATFLSGVTLAQFEPGRIGHHAMETVCLVFAVGAAVASLDPARARQAALAGALVALGLAMSLETMPFLGALCAAMVLAWVARGVVLAPMLAWFGAGLGLALAMAILVTVAPGHRLAPVCDAFGAAHCGAGLVGAAGCCVLALASRRLPNVPVRLLGAVALGGLVVAFVTLAYPACLRSPFAGVDPLVRQLWLDHVVESKPLQAFMRDRPMLGLAMLLPLALGTTAGLVAAARTRGTTRLRFATIAGLAALGLALGFWQVRVLASVAPLAACGGLPVVAALRERLGRRGLAALAPVLIVPFTATAWALLLPADAAPTSDQADCLAPSAFAPLAGLAPGSAVAPLNAGSHLLEATPLDVFAAPYHRNNDGNRFAFDVFRATPDMARALLAARHVAYVITCPGGGPDRVAASAPSGLAAALAQGHVPAFLARVPLAPTPYQVYAVAPDD